MMRMIWLVPLFGLLATVGRSQESNLVTEPREALRGLSGVSLDAQQNGCNGIVNPEIAKQDIEVKLRIAGIKVTPLPVATLGVMANCMPIEAAGRRLYTVVHFSLSVNQIM